MAAPAQSGLAKIVAGRHVAEVRALFGDDPVAASALIVGAYSAGYMKGVMQAAEIVQGGAKQAQA